MVGKQDLFSLVEYCSGPLIAGGYIVCFLFVLYIYIGMVVEKARCARPSTLYELEGSSADSSQKKMRTSRRLGTHPGERSALERGEVTSESAGQ